MLFLSKCVFSDVLSLFARLAKWLHETSLLVDPTCRGSAKALVAIVPVDRRGVQSLIPEISGDDV